MPGTFEDVEPGPLGSPLDLRAHALLAAQPGRHFFFSLHGIFLFLWGADKARFTRYILKSIFESAFSASICILFNGQV
jgi:hypothetical protein